MNKKISWLDGFLKIISFGLIKPKEEVFNFQEELKRAACQFNADSFIKITSKQFSLIIRNKFTNKVGNMTQRRDSDYYLLPQEVLKIYNYIFCKTFPIAMYKKNVFDCDDFADSYKSNFNYFARHIPNAKLGFAIMAVSGHFHWAKGHHQINLFINEQKQVKFIDPEGVRIKPVRIKDRLTFSYG